MSNLKSDLDAYFILFDGKVYSYGFVLASIDPDQRDSDAMFSLSGLFKAYEVENILPFWMLTPDQKKIINKGVSK